MQLTQQIISALTAKYSASRAEALANLNNYFENPVGVGEHPNIVAEADKLISAIAETDGKVESLKAIVELINENRSAQNESSDNRK